MYTKFFDKIDELYIDWERVFNWMIFVLGIFY